MNDAEGCVLSVLTFLIGIIISGVFFYHCGVGDYRRLQVECGKAHYDERTGYFVDHEKEARGKQD